MILGDRVNKVEVEAKDRTKYEGLKINIKIEDVKETKDGKLEFYYTTAYDYGPMGYMKISGTILAEEEKKERKRLLDSWKKNKSLPKDYLEKLLNVINFVDSAHGTIIARVVNIRPPIRAMRLTIKEK